jgi:hypothetical protein
MTRSVFLRMSAFLVAVALILGTVAPVINASTTIRPFVTLDQGSSIVLLSGSLKSGEAAPVDPDNGGIKNSPAYTVTLGAWRNIRPTESTLNGVSMLPSTYPVDCVQKTQKSKGWIVGDSGTILTYCNGVWDQAITTESIPTHLLGVQAISPTLSVAVGQDGTVLMYMYDRTANDWVWKKSPIPIGNQWLYSVSMVPDGSDGYTGWSVGTADPAAGGRGALIRGYISAPVTYPDMITSTHDYTWDRVTNDYGSLPPIGSYYSVHTLSPTNAWAVGGTWGTTQGLIVHWDGSDWAVFQETEGPLYGMRMRTATDGWAVGSLGVTYHFNGSIWTKVDSHTTVDLTSVSYAPDGTTWAVGTGGTILFYDSPKGMWTTFTDKDNVQNLRTDLFDYRGIDFSSGHGWLVGTHYAKGIGGQILEYDDSLWLAVTPPTDNKLNHVSTVNDNDAWAVGDADSAGGTIIHWDGKHWVRWYQYDLPIPAVNLNAIDMVSAVNGWAAGDTPSPGKPAIYLQWDGTRWAEPRYDAPVNVRVNDISMSDDPAVDGHFGWSVADNGDAIPKYENVGSADYWSALHSCQGAYYQLRGTSLITTSSPNPWGSWDAWSVGSRIPINNQDPPPNQSYAVFMRFLGGCAGSNAWQEYAVPSACPRDNPNDPPPTDGPYATWLRAIQMRPGPWGFAVGNYQNRAVVHQSSGSGWGVSWCMYEQGPNPSQFNAVDIVKSTGVTWVGGYYTPYTNGLTWKWAYIIMKDSGYWRQAPAIFPRNGRNIWHRPIKSISMSSDTMGWAVGDGYSDDPNKSVIYQYPFPNFTLNSTPSARAVLPGNSTFFTITVNSLGGFDTNVTLSLLDLPAGMSASIVPASVNASSIATVYVTTTAGMPQQIYQLPLQGMATFRSGDTNVTVSRVSTLKLTVTDHPVYSVSPDHGKAGTVVTITGANFGTDPGTGNRSTAANHVTWAKKWVPDGNILSWSSSQITFIPPDSPALFSPAKFPLTGNVSVTAGGTTSNDDYLFKIDPFISDLAPVQSASVISVTITGTSFGSDPGSLNRSTYYEHVSLGKNRIPNSNVKSWSNTQIVFTLPITSTGGDVRVTSNGYETEPVLLAIGTTESKVFLPLVKK